MLESIIISITFIIISAFSYIFITDKVSQKNKIIIDLLKDRIK